MIKVIRYADLFGISESSIQARMEHDFMKFWDMYGGSNGLMDYRLDELGELGYLESGADTEDLSVLGYTGSFSEQLFEYVERENRGSIKPY